MITDEAKMYQIDKLFRELKLDSKEQIFWNFILKFRDTAFYELRKGNPDVIEYGIDTLRHFLTELEEWRTHNG